MKLKKIAGLVLAAVLTVTLMTSCNKKQTGGDVNTSEIMARTDIENYEYPRQIELRIPVYDRGTTGQAPVTDNYWTKYVQKEFGDKHNIKTTFIAIPRKAEVTSFNQLLAGKKEDQPSIIYNYDYPVISSFAKQEVFQEIDVEMVKKYAPTFYEKTKALEEHTLINGKKLFLAANRPKSYSYVHLIRKDWLDKIGAEPWSSNEEHWDVLRKFRDMKLGGEKTIPLTKKLPDANYGGRPTSITEEEIALYCDITVASLTYAPTKKNIEDDNLLYNEGLVSPEWYLDKDGSKMREDFISGRAGIFGTYLSKNLDIIGALKKNCPDAEVEVMAYNYPPNKNQNIERAENPFGLVSGININYEYPEAVLMYYEWMQKNIFVMQNGIEGLTYKTEGEIPVLIDGYQGDERLNYSSNKDMWCLVVEGKDLGSEELNLEAQKVMYAPAGYEYLIDQAYEKEQNRLKYVETYEDYVFSKPLESLAKYSENLKNKWQVIYTDLVNCKPSEFEAKYEAACKDYLASGYQEILDEKKKLYGEDKFSGN